MKRLLWLGLTIGVAALVFHGSASRSDQPKALMTLSASETPLQNSSGAAEDSEDRYAWEEFALLVHPTSANSGALPNQPAWVAWSNKCDAGLQVLCKDIPPNSSRSIPADRTAADIPGQVIQGFETEQPKHKWQFVQSFSQAPQLASVLFNQEAADSIINGKLGSSSTLNTLVQHLDTAKVTGANRRIPDRTFKVGSEILKLIWEVVPEDGSESLRLYDLAKPPRATGLQQLNGVPSWGTYFVTSSIQTCPQLLPPYGSLNTKVTVPLNCFYWFPIQTKDSCTELSTTVRTAWCQVGVRQQNFAVVLVGVHIMKLTGSNPNWIWMTYYWTRETNGRPGWVAPWNHFRMFTTTAIQDEAADEHKFVYNPYLEGVENNGLQSNCLSCHAFAAYSPYAPKLEDGVALGLKYPYAKAARLQGEESYFANAVQTAFVWSISTSHPVPTHGKLELDLFPQMLKKALRDEYMTQ